MRTEVVEGFGLSLAFLRRAAFVPDMEKFCTLRMRSISTTSTRSLVVTAAVVVEIWACTSYLLKSDKFGLTKCPLADNFSPQYGFDNIRNKVTRKFNIISIIDLYW